VIKKVNKLANNGVIRPKNGQTERFGSEVSKTGRRIFESEIAGDGVEKKPFWMSKPETTS
jgi:hypothetical protein